MIKIEDAKKDRHSLTWIELARANIYWNTIEDSLKAITPKTQVIPNIGMTAPKIFVADLKQISIAKIFCMLLAQNLE